MDLLHSAVDYSPGYSTGLINNIWIAPYPDSKPVLKMPIADFNEVWLNGEMDCSEIVAITATEKPGFSIHTHGQRLWLIPSDALPYHLRLMDLAGRELFLETRLSTSHIDLELLSAGVYVISLTDSDGKSFIRKFLKR